MVYCYNLLGLYHILLHNLGHSLLMSCSAQLPQLGVRPGASEPNRFYMYGVIGRLAMLAASYELEATDPERDTYDE
jgi:hypothetical protein